MTDRQTRTIFSVLKGNRLTEGQSFIQLTKKLFIPAFPKPYHLHTKSLSNTNTGKEGEHTPDLRCLPVQRGGLDAGLLGDA